MSQRTATIHRDSLGIIKEADTERLLGTGFLCIRPNWIVTAKHVILDQHLPRENLNVSFLGGDIAARVIYTHTEVDLAVLELSHILCDRPLPAGHFSMVGLRGLFCAGYAPRLTQANGGPAIQVNDVPHFTTEIRERNFGNEEIIVFDAPFSEGGHSGGPVLGDGGCVVGVIIQNFLDNERTYARATSLQPLLNDLALPILSNTQS